MQQSTQPSSSRAEAWSRWFFLLIGGLCIVAMCCIVSVDVVLRDVFHRALSWSIEVNSVLLVIVVFSAFPYALVRDVNVRMAAVVEALPRKLRKVAEFVAFFSMAATWGLMSIALLRMAQDMFKYGKSTEEFGLPLWPVALFAGLVSIVCCGLALAGCYRQTLPGKGE